MAKPVRIGLMWDNFGPLHVDRALATARALEGRGEVVALELFSQSDTYGWDSASSEALRKVTLLPDGGFAKTGAFPLAKAIVSACRRERLDAVFLCHYQFAGVLLAAFVLRLLGVRVLTMGCSKFDDLPRKAWREWAKTVYLLPYQGAIGSYRRSVEYFEFLGIPRAAIAGGYNTVSHDRIRTLAGTREHGEPDFADRPFVCVARLVPKKNHAALLEAYARYRRIASHPRPLLLYGNGPLEPTLRETAKALGISDDVRFMGFCQTAEIAVAMRDALCLLLPSTIEQFGNVVPEAQALRLPAIVSTACGAADELVLGGINGYVVKPENIDGLAIFMQSLSDDEALWQRLRDGVAATADRGDAARFGEAVVALLAVLRVPL